jgi:SAM-dependent methyltransferase
MPAKPSERQLSADQLGYFRRDITPQRAEQHRKLVQLICDAAGNGSSPVRMADLGGGDGRVLDGCLDARPGSTAVLVDVAQEMVDANLQRPDKTVLRGNLVDLDPVLPEGMLFDVILFNVVLHHCIDDSVAATRDLQRRILRAAAGRLAPGGRILVLEQVHESPLVPDLAPWFIYQLTSSRILPGILRPLGANTAGVGVLFASERRLLRLFESAELDVSDARLFRMDGHSWKLLVSGVTRSYQKLFVLQPRGRT